MCPLLWFWKSLVFVTGTELMQKQIAVQKSFLSSFTIKSRFWTIDFIVDLMEIDNPINWYISNIIRNILFRILEINN